ncbi:hypothetical protein [Pseudomonas aeruginosa]|uniref:hypothetical protein n=1 Tax=Pseudomonas aeruginosa TaxID=287 RepID=UPI000BB871C5|nr:hypothetical protein [Pseudomonas aeruginosa]ELN9532197.1 hypothetical protein [Pseudomonas aeruginosa]PBV12697.1 hypothetical protein CJU34_17640 [Pseudomonas aeruginosa]
MSIDWSKAPEGATHWEPTGPKFHEGWMKKEGNKWFYWGKGSEKWLNTLRYCNVPAEREATFEARPQEQWDGQGLPPVGTLCEFAGGTYSPEDPFDNDLREGDRVTIIAHFKDGDLDLAAFTFNPQVRNPNRGAACVEQGAYGCFRPLCTPEQIAAEEREKAIEEMCFAEETLTVKQAKALYEAGYRRQESST